MAAQPPGPDPGAPALSLLVRELIQAGEAASQSMARRLRVGVTDVQALDHLDGAGEIGPVELGERLGLRSASATALVDRLERAGHVERRRHPSDRRRVSVVVTDHARGEAYDALRPLLELMGAVEVDLTDAEREVIERYLRGATAAFKAYAKAEEGSQGTL